MIFKHPANLVVSFISCIYYAYFKGGGAGLLIHNAFFNGAIIIEEKSHQRYTQSAHFTLMCCRYPHVGKYNNFSHSKQPNASRNASRETVWSVDWKQKQKHKQKQKQIHNASD